MRYGLVLAWLSGLGCGADHVVGSLGLPPAIDPPGFLRQESPAGLYPNAISTADFDGDGRSDLVVANSFVGQVSVLLGLGNGRFAAPRSFDIGERQRRMALFVADINGDARPDLLIANSAAGGLALINQALPQGMVGFSAPDNYALVALSVVAADLDNDGRTDVAYGTTLGSVDIRLGEPTGLGLPKSFVAGQSGPLMTLVDGDRDGRSDLALLDPTQKVLQLWRNRGTKGAPRFDPLSVVLSDPPTALSAMRRGALLVILAENAGLLVVPPDLTAQNITALTLPAGAIPVAAASGEISGGAPEDIVVANLGLNTISIHRGLPATDSLMFNPGAHYATCATPTALCIADLDQDGADDIAVSCLDDHAVQIFLRRRP